jgi:hypothetical protein
MTGENQTASEHWPLNIWVSIIIGIGTVLIAVMVLTATLWVTAHRPPSDVFSAQNVRATNPAR